MKEAAPIDHVATPLAQPASRHSWLTGSERRPGFSTVRSSGRLNSRRRPPLWGCASAYRGVRFETLSRLGRIRCGARIRQERLRHVGAIPHGSDPGSQVPVQEGDRSL